VPWDDETCYAFVAYPIDLFEEVSVVNVFTSMVGNVFGFKALRHLRPEDVRFPLAFVKTCGGPNGFRVERDPQYLRNDTKEAVEELAAEGITTYNLTLDSQGDDYVGRIFGPGGYTVLDNIQRPPEKLPDLFAGLTT